MYNSPINLCQKTVAEVLKRFDSQLITYGSIQRDKVSEEELIVSSNGRLTTDDRRQTQMAIVKIKCAAD